MAQPKTDARTSILFEMFPQTPKRSEKRILDIVEAAIECYATLGIERTTYATIAKLGKMSRPLVLHYFKDKETIFDLCVKYIRINFQKFAVSAMENKKTPHEMLTAYVESTFAWMDKFPHHTRVWTLFYLQCTTQKKALRLNTELTQAGHVRIEAILRAGTSAKAFKCSDPKTTAKMIQTLITGAMIVSGTEELDQPRYRRAVLEQCLALARTK